jgi:hypothetical protein
MSTDFERFTTLTPAPQHERALSSVLDEVLAWTGASSRQERRSVEPASASANVIY